MSKRKRRSVCAQTEQRRSRDRIRKAKYRRERYEYAVAFLGGKCCLCSSTENLQFDHWHPWLKRGPLMRFYSYGQRFHDELEKVVLLCTACHTEKTSEQRKNKPIPPEAAPF